ncbi:MAG: Hpt domain-containing protein [Pseudomonadota bacterium]
MLRRMIMKLIDRVKRMGAGSSSNEDQMVDIARVLPGYTPPADRNETASPDVDFEVVDPDFVAASSVDAPSETPFVLTEEIPANESESTDDQNTTWLRRDLDRLYSSWEETQADQDNMSKFVRAAHDLKGMSDTYGYPSIQRLMISLDTLLTSQSDAPNFALINLHVEACRAAFAQGLKGDASDAVADSVCSALEDQVARATS